MCIGTCVIYNMIYLLSTAYFYGREKYSAYDDAYRTNNGFGRTVFIFNHDR